MDTVLPLESASSRDETAEDVLEELAGVERLSPEQVSLCQYRHMLLCYLDRLSTYQVRTCPFSSPLLYTGEVLGR